jgi:hypothetical protein
LFFLIFYTVLVGGYFTARYNMKWMESDTSTITLAIQDMQNESRLIAEEGLVYPHGYAYQTVSVALAGISGLPVTTLQAAVWPAGADRPGAGCFRVLQPGYQRPGHGCAGFAAAVSAAGRALRHPARSHEKLDWPLVMITLTLLYRSAGLPWRSMSVHILLFYAGIFAISATNAFFASTFAAALLLGLLLGLALVTRGRRGASTPVDLKRLVYAVLACVVIIFGFMIYIYPIALDNLRTLRTILDQVSALLLSFEALGQPYEYISFGWINTQTYFGLTVFTWLLIASSLAIWAWRGVHPARARTSEPAKQPGLVVVRRVCLPARRFYPGRFLGRAGAEHAAQDIPRFYHPCGGGACAGHPAGNGLLRVSWAGASNGLGPGGPGSHLVRPGSGVQSDQRTGPEQQVEFL